MAGAAVVALRIMSHAGFSGGAVISDPAKVETDTGVMTLGDWSQKGVLKNYSGGVRYSTGVRLSEAETAGEVVLDLGRYTKH